MPEVSRDRVVYEQLCHKTKDIPLFFQPWWLDAVAPGKWEPWVAIQGGEPVGIWPIVEARKGIFRGAGMPLLTPFLGLWLFYPSIISNYHKLSLEEKTINAFLKQFKPVNFFEQVMPTYLSNWLPWYWNGYQQTIRYTYQLELQDPKIAWENLSGKMRREIRHAEKIVGLKKGGESRIIYENVGKSLQKNGKNWIASPLLVDKLFQEAKSRQCGEQYYACDKDGNIHAAVWVVWDQSTAYLLARGGDARLMRSGAMKYLVWAIIEKFSGRVSKIDFVGSQLKPVERFIRHFGAKQTPMHFIYRYDSKLLSLAKSLQQNIRFGARRNNA